MTTNQHTLDALHAHIDGSWDNIPAEIIDITLLDIYVKVGGFGDGYSLWWSDGVANDWTEFHPSLSQVMARVATLLYCGEHEWNKYFSDFAADAHQEFADQAASFFDAATY